MSRFSFLRSNRQAPVPGKAGSDLVDDQDFVAVAPKRSGRQKDGDDPALPEKKRARRRLVGAITLTLAAVIVLPLVFDPEPKPISQDVAVEVSSKIKSKPAAPEQDPVQQVAPQDSAVQPAAQNAVAPAAVAAVAGTAAVAAVAAKSAASSAEAPKSEAKTAPKPEAKPEAAKTPVAKPTAETKSAAAQQGKYIIQVAALATQKKAADLQAKLKSAGISSHTQKVATRDGERIRVRIGPLASKKEADGTCAKLGKMKLSCTLVAN